MAKRTVFWCIVLILSACMVRADWPVSLKGEIRLDLTVNNLDIGYDNVNEYYVKVHELEYGGTRLGKGILEIEIDGEDGLYRLDNEGYAGELEIQFKPEGATVSRINAELSADSGLCIPNFDKMFCRFNARILKGDEEKGEFSYGINFEELGEENIARGQFRGNGVVYVDASIDLGEVFLEIPEDIREYYTGAVLYADGSPVVSAKFMVSHEIEGVVLKSVYKIEGGLINGGSRIEVRAPKGTIVRFYVDNKEVEGDIIEEDGKVNSLRIELPVNNENGFEDEDRDGVPDNSDKCPGSESKSVDIYGCNCEQKECTESICMEGKRGPECVETCNDGFKNQNEEEVDCGGVCESCEKKEEVKPGCTDCRECGCPDSFECEEDGSCKKTIHLEPLRCKVNEYEFSYEKIDCAEKGEEWIEEDKNKHITLHFDAKPALTAMSGGSGAVVGGGLAGGGIGLVGGSLLEKLAEKFIRKKFEEATLCIKTRDMGCVLPDVQCMGEEYLTAENVQITEDTIEKEANERIRDQKAMGFGRSVWSKFMEVRLDADLSEYDLEVQGGKCEDLVADSRKSCRLLLKHGSTDDKLDLLFIGDGYSGDEQLRKKVMELIDYDGKYDDTEKRGFFADEPYKSNKERFNIWYIDPTGEIEYGINDSYPYRGRIPFYADILEAANYCPWFDIIVFISERNQFGTHHETVGINNICLLGLGGEIMHGRMLVHELGHGIGDLADEYLRIEEEKEADNRIKNSPSDKTGPNCKSTLDEAKAAWGDLVGKEIGYFEGCGARCGEDCAEFLRPTQNSIMRHEFLKEGVNCTEEEWYGVSCELGPPFDGYYAVNEKTIQKKLNRYTRKVTDFYFDREGTYTEHIDSDDEEAEEAALSSEVSPISISSQMEVNELTVTANGAVVSSDGEITEIEWDWGDETVEKGFFPMTHTYASEGKYEISIVAADDRGDLEGITRQFILSINEGAIDVSYTVQIIEFTLYIDFEAKSSEDILYRVRYGWESPERITGAAYNYKNLVPYKERLTHIYKEKGDYEAILIFEDGKGNEKAVNVPIKIK